MGRGADRARAVAGHTAEALRLPPVWRPRGRGGPGSGCPGTYVRVFPPRRGHTVGAVRAQGHAEPLPRPGTPPPGVAATRAARRDPGPAGRPRTFRSDQGTHRVVGSTASVCG